MKLIYCPSCHDVLKLQAGDRKCWCGASWGTYHGNGVNVTIGGRAVPLGIDNLSFLNALAHRPADGLGRTFTAFVIPKYCDHIEQE